MVHTKVPFTRPAVKVLMWTEPSRVEARVVPSCRLLGPPSLPLGFQTTGTLNSVDERRALVQ
jgi:hypothetical protein